MLAGDAAARVRHHDRSGAVGVEMKSDVDFAAVRV